MDGIHSSVGFAQFGLGTLTDCLRVPRLGDASDFECFAAVFFDQGVKDCKFLSRDAVPYFCAIFRVF